MMITLLFLLLHSRDGMPVLFLVTLVKKEPMMPFGGSTFFDFFVGLMLMMTCCAKQCFVVNRSSKM